MFPLLASTFKSKSISKYALNACYEQGTTIGTIYNFTIKRVDRLLCRGHVSIFFFFKFYY